MKSLFRYVLLSVLLFTCMNGYCDDRQKGISRAGGITDFGLLYPQDSIVLNKLDVLSRKIAIQIYRGFAVVKTEYKMRNASDDLFTLKIGYPVNSSYSVTGKDSSVSSIFFDPLYALKSYHNGRENMLTRQPLDTLQPLDDNNWYVWTDTFKPKDTTSIVVCFIVNTNNAEVNGVTKKTANNVFLYLNNNTIRKPVADNEAKIELMDELRITDIHGLLPASGFKTDDQKNVLLYKSSNQLPGSDNNIVLVYTPAVTAYDFSYVSQRRLALFGSIDAFFQQNENDLQLKEHLFDTPYQVAKVKWASLLDLGLLVAGSIIGLILIVWLLRWLLRLMQQQRSSRGTEM